MNRTLKRVLGLTGSVALGIAGAVTFASGAQAHHPEITGSTECAENGDWTVTWKVTDWDSDNGSTGVITEILEAELNEASEIYVGAELPLYGSSDYLEGSQTFGSDVESASITIKAKWDKDDWNHSVYGERSHTVFAPADGCDEEPPAEPEPEFEYGGGSDCVATHVWAENYNPDALAEFTFDPSNGEPVTVTPGVDDPYSNYFLVDSAEEGLTVDVYLGEELIDTIEWVDNVLCSYVGVEADCEGMTFTMSVPADAGTTYFTLWTSLSDESETIEIAAGGTESRTYKAVGDEELWVEYYIEAPKDATGGGFQWIPCDEESPSPSETPSAQPDLPVTGSSLTIMVGSAAALIVAAAAIFLFMRRRRAAQDW